MGLCQVIIGKQEYNLSYLKKRGPIWNFFWFNEALLHGATLGSHEGGKEQQYSYAGSKLYEKKESKRVQRYGRHFSLRKNPGPGRLIAGLGREKILREEP